MCVAVLALAAPQEPQPGRSATVGMREVIPELVLPGSELVTAPADPKDPVVVRVLAVRPHGSAFRYDLEWTGLVAGDHDLSKRLARKDGTPTADLPAIPVQVRSVLPKGVTEPSPQAPIAPPRLAGYSALQWLVGFGWVLGLLLILFLGRRRRAAKAPPPPPAPTLADRLRPLVDAVAAGRADVAAQAELERLLVAFWRHRLGLTGHKAGDALPVIKAHPEAGALVRAVESWLHAPQRPTGVALDALLQPYRTVQARDFDVPAGAEVR